MVITRIDARRFGPWALVTGASSGIGAGLLCQFAESGPTDTPALARIFGAGDGRRFAAGALAAERTRAAFGAGERSE